MALTVYPYLRDPRTGAPRPLEGRPTPPCDELAGTEASRTDLWGSEVVRALGCALLPRLAEGPLYVEGTALEDLTRELEVIRRELRRVAAATEYRTDYLSARLGNVLDAVRRARAAGGGVAVE